VRRAKVVHRDQPPIDHLELPQPGTKQKKKLKNELVMFEYRFVFRDKCILLQHLEDSQNSWRNFYQSTKNKKRKKTGPVRKNLNLCVPFSENLNSFSASSKSWPIVPVLITNKGIS
jgi:hypothetical protein